ncbi:type IV pili twitching motility protein PilT, partial [Klebsiella pneumoniae]|nr:type IV pili twitching motility protein PilT [Klebsiella pneumoniae]
GEISLQDALKNADSAHDLRLAVQLRSRRAQSSSPDLELL